VLVASLMIMAISSSININTIAVSASPCAFLNASIVSATIALI